jgi:hypothetical protein
MQHFTSFLLTFKPYLLLKGAVFLLNAGFVIVIPDAISCLRFASFYHSAQLLEIFHILQLFVICHLYWGWFPGKSQDLDRNAQKKFAIGWADQ